MEISKDLKQDLSALETACSRFLEKYESQLTESLQLPQMSAEESLKADLMLELITHLSSVQFVSSYMQKDVAVEGTLTLNDHGELTLDGTVLPQMCDIEVYVYDEELEQDVWKRVLASSDTRQKIFGLKQIDLSAGIRARIRK